MKLVHASPFFGRQLAVPGALLVAVATLAWLVVATLLAVLLGACAGWDDPSANDTRSTPDWPCGKLATSCGHNECCPPNNVCGGNDPTCPPGECCYVGESNNDFGRKRPHTRQYRPGEPVPEQP